MHQQYRLYMLVSKASRKGSRWVHGDNRGSMGSPALQRDERIQALLQFLLSDGTTLT